MSQELITDDTLSSFDRKVNGYLTRGATVVPGTHQMCMTGYSKFGRKEAYGIVLDTSNMGGES